MSLRVLPRESTSGNIGLISRSPTSTQESPMIASSIRRVCLIVLLVNLFIAFGPAAPSHAQTKAANATAAANANTAAAAWSVKVNGGIRWQQITPAGALLVATDSSLAGVDID